MARTKTKLRKAPTKTAATRKGATSRVSKASIKFEEPAPKPAPKKKKKPVKKKTRSEANV